MMKPWKIITFYILIIISIYLSYVWLEDSFIGTVFNSISNENFQDINVYAIEAKENIKENKIYLIEYDKYKEIYFVEFDNKLYIIAIPYDVEIPLLTKFKIKYLSNINNQLYGVMKTNGMKFAKWIIENIRKG
jgi:hypothetical protein